MTDASIKKSKYTCSKCKHSKYESGEIRAAGSFWTKIFNIQNKKFLSISCKKCGHTEFYSQDKAKTVENIFDFLIG